VLSEDLPSDEVESFLALAREFLADLYIRLATARLTPAQEAELWRLVDGVEAAMRMRAVVLDLGRDAIARELDEYDFMAGDFDYKRKLGSQQRELHWLVWRAPSLKMKTFELAKRARQQLLSMRG
jgi:hypothetical protein